MLSAAVKNHPQRYAMTNELHARPFIGMGAPGRMVHLALKQVSGSADRDPEADRRHVIEYIDRLGGQHPAPDANQYTADFDRFRMKWERHTEFVSYTLYQEGGTDDLFETDLARTFPEDWLAKAPGEIVAAIDIEIVVAENRQAAEDLLGREYRSHFNGESIAVADVLDGAALAVGDFRIHEGGFSRFLVIVHGSVGQRRLGRTVQRLIEIETYRALAMLALPLARVATRRLNEIDRELAELIAAVARDAADKSESAILERLTGLSAEIEALSAQTAFRFSAAAAYEAIVHARIEALREERLSGRQLFSEFMLRRFDPAMRTCSAVHRRLSELAARASRVAELLRTRVSVAVEAQNQRLLESMDQRAALQLRLQETVEGLSVVAISYYAVSLAGYLIAPVALGVGIEKPLATALIAIPIIGGVWWFVRSMRRRLEDRK